MFTDKIGLEADVFYYSTQPNTLSYTGPNVTEMPIHGRLTYNAPMGKGLGVIFGLGYAYNMWGDDASTSTSTSTDERHRADSSACASAPAARCRSAWISPATTS